MFLKDWFYKKIDKEVNWLFAILTVLAVILIRTFLETFSSPGYQGYFFGGYATFLHIPLFYISIITSLALSIFYFGKLRFNQAVNLAIFFSPIITLPPLIDLLLSGGSGFGIAYLFFDNFKEALFDFITFFGKFSGIGVTPGLRVEITLIIIGFTYLIYIRNRSIIRTILGGLFCYAIFFFYASFPSFFAILFGQNNLFAPSGVNNRPILVFLNNLFSSSLVGSIHSLNNLPLDNILLADQQFDILVSRILWLLLVFQAFWLFYLAQPQIFNTWRKHLRWERVIYYLAIVILGIFLGLRVSASVPSFNALDILGLIILFILVALSCWLAAGLNDLSDVKTDSINSPDRPLVKGAITVKQQNLICLFLFLFVVAGLATINYLVLILFLLFQAVYFIYSVPPLRLKRIFGLSSLLVGANALIMTMAGFYFVSPIQKISFFPKHLLALVLFAFTLAVNIKDIKDYEGDKTEGIKTIPVIFGPKAGKIIIGSMAVIALWLVALVTTVKGIAMASLIFSPIFFILITRKDYEEKPIFSAFFIYVIVCIIYLIIK